MQTILENLATVHQRAAPSAVPKPRSISGTSRDIHRFCLRIENNALRKLCGDMHEIGRFIDDALGLSAPSANDLTVAQVGLRGVVVYFVLILFVRVGKKRFLGQATAFDAVLIILIGSVASRAVSGTAPFVASLAATLSFIVVHWLVSYFAQRSSTLSFLVKGHDTLLIKNGRVDQSALRAAHMSPDDLEEDLRQQGIKSTPMLKKPDLSEAASFQ